ncbi:MAG TPA: hypothetical protein VGA61_02560 [Anaerolineae bacterium]
MSDQVKLLLAFNIKTGQEPAYRRFVLEEFLPMAQELGLLPTDAWHTAYGDYPARLIGFVADDLETLQNARSNQRWRTLFKKLEGYTGNLTQRVVPFKGGFQW